MLSSWFSLTSPRGPRKDEKEKEKADVKAEQNEPIVGNNIVLLDAQKLDLSSSLRMAVKNQSMMVDELRKDRIKDIIRRDLNFPQVYELAMEGNSERACAPRYKQLYDSYKNIYKVHLFEEKVEDEEIEKAKEKKKQKRRSKRDQKREREGEGKQQQQGNGESKEGEEEGEEMMTKAEAKKKLKELDKLLQSKLVIMESLDKLLALQTDPVEKNKTQESLNLLNDEIVQLEKKIAIVTGYTYGLNRNQQLIEFDIKWAKDNLSNREISEDLIRIQQKLRCRNEQKILLTGGKRQVLGQQEAQTVTWESKSEKQLIDLFGSLEKAREIRKMNKEQLDRVVQRITVQMEELSKLEKNVAYHYGFCTEILKRASDLQHMEDLIVRLRSVAKRNKDDWTKEVIQQLEKDKEQASQRRSASFPTPQQAPSSGNTSPQKSDSASWNFSDMVKEAKTSAEVPTRQSASEPITSLAPPPSPLANLKSFLSPGSRGSLYKIKEDVMKQLLQEEEEAYESEQRGKKGLVQDDGEEEEAAAVLEKQKKDREDKERKEREEKERKRQEEREEQERKKRQQHQPSIVVEDKEEGEKEREKEKRREKKKKEREDNKSDDEVEEVLKGSISEATFKLLKEKEHLLWADDPRDRGEGEGEGGRGGGTLAAPTGADYYHQGGRGKTGGNNKSNSHWTSDDLVRVRVSKSAKRRARRKRQKETVAVKMQEEQERDELVDKVMQLVQGGSNAQAINDIEDEARLEKEDMWVFKL